MTATLDLLARFKTAKSITSDNAAAHELGLTRGAISRWRNSGGQAEPHVVEAMCKALGIDVLPWLARIESERAHGSENAKVWASVARRLGAATAVAFVALMSQFATVRAEAGTGFASCDVYIMRTLRWLRGAFRAARAT